MNVPSPLHITSRLEAGLTLPGVGTLSVSDLATGDYQYAWRIEDSDGRELGYGEDMRCPMAEDYGEPMRSLLSFLGAAAESYPDGENADLFNPAVVEWAQQNSDELSMAEWELDPDNGEYVGRCPVCGDVIDYCQGHGEIGDPAGFAILTKHDDGDHSECHPDGCDDASAS